MFPIVRVHALGALALVALRRGLPERSLDLVENAIAAAAQGTFAVLLSSLHLTRAEALHALGRTNDANEAIRQARERILRIANTLNDHPDLRESFLTAVAANTRTLELSKSWLGEQAARPS